ncbi:MAG TPA: TetR family transcriptional regulator [Spirochaetota bacterium]|nr:TetR family transcriptional regulator [Spirochaetota bacterium]HQQ22526.1 TetR family transcriptional regulator [Spirochaetota bacterium]
MFLMERNFKRAVSDEQKNEKTALITSAAEKLFESDKFERITIEKIAKQAGIAKGTVFIYFKTKEEIFLSIAEKETANWKKNLCAAIESACVNGKKITTEALCNILISSLENNNFIKLISILDDTLEQNIDFKKALHFKKYAKSEMEEISSIIEASSDTLKPGSGIIILNSLYTCAIGAFKVSNPSDTVKKITKRPGMEIFDRNFNDIMRHISMCYIKGFIASGS